MISSYRGLSLSASAWMAFSDCARWSSCLRSASTWPFAATNSLRASYTNQGVGLMVYMLGIWCDAPCSSGMQRPRQAYLADDALRCL